MCLFVVFLFGIIFACRIPGLLKMLPPEGVLPEFFEEWRRLELRSIYFFIGATWGAAALLTAVGVLISALSPSNQVDERTGMVIAFGILADLIPLIWAALLSSRAAKVKKQFPVQAHSYYPRAGQYPRQGMPPMPPINVQSPEPPPVIRQSDGESAPPS